MKRLFFIPVILFLSFSVSAQEIKKVKAAELVEIINKTNSPVIINFWATFCMPCLKEIPYFEELVKKYKDSGLQLILVSLDMEEEYPKGLKSFIKKRKFASPVWWLNEENADYFIPLIDKSWSGSIPASLFINNKTGYRRFYEDEFGREQLEKEIIKLIAQQSH